MEKEYSTIEALEMLSKNKNLAFKIKPTDDQDENCTQRISSNMEGIIFVDCNGCDCGEDCNMSLNDKWKLVQQPVSFIEAVNSGKLIRYEEWGTLYDSLGGAMSILNVKSEEEQRKIINGKWYIKED